MTTPPHFRAIEAPGWEARVVDRQPMAYREGPSKVLDRPPHVRAASGLSAYREYIAVIQDDANWLALVDREGKVTAVPLPPSPNGDRVFSKKRGNQRDKFDLEACVTVRSGNDLELIGFASGSRDERESLLRVREESSDPAAGAVSPRFRAEFIAAPSFYAMMREAHEFSGAGLNIEGALALESDRIRLFQRGNAESRDGLDPVDATADLDWSQLRRHLDDPARNPPPALENIRSYDLGELEGVRLTFSDAELLSDGRVLYSASAEGSEGTIRGSVLGVIEADGKARWTRLFDSGGQHFTGKIEGLTRLHGEAGRIHFVIDDDKENEPSAIYVAELSNHFFSADATR